MPSPVHSPRLRRILVAYTVNRLRSWLGLVALSPRLRRILVAYTVNRLGSWIGLVALSLAVFDHTRSAVAVAGLLFAWEALPAFIVPVVVARVEASARRYELAGLYFLEAAATTAIAVLLPHFSLPPLLLLAAVDGTAALASNALLRAEVARCGREQLVDRALIDRPAEATVDTAHDAERRANAALNVALSLSLVAGPVLGGLVTAGLGAPTALLVDVVSFAICGALVLDLHPHVKEAAGRSARSALQVAWRHVREMHQLRMLLLTEMVALLFIQSAGPIEVVYAKASLNAGDRGYGLLLTAWGGGAVVGSAVFARTRDKPLASVLSAGTIALAVAFVGYALAPSLALGCLAAAVGGVGNMLEWPALISLVQLMSPPELHGRLMAAVESMSSLCAAVGLLAGGALVALASPRWAFLIVGLAVAAASAMFVRLAVTGSRMTDTGGSASRRGLEDRAADAQRTDRLPPQPDLTARQVAKDASL